MPSASSHPGDHGRRKILRDCVYDGNHRASSDDRPHCPVLVEAASHRTSFPPPRRMRPLRFDASRRLPPVGASIADFAKAYSPVHPAILYPTRLSSGRHLQMRSSRLLCPGVASF